MAGEPGQGWNGAARSTGAVHHTREKFEWPAGREFRLLSIDGGGIKGIFTAALLARLESVSLAGRGLASSFDMIAATSTGAIIALALAAGVPARDILKLYLDRGSVIFPRKRQFGVIAPAFDASVLQQELESMFGARLLGDVATRLCIPSADGKYGDVAVFKTPHHPDLKRDWTMRIVDVALASSAAPTFLPVHRTGGYHFIDGGIWANNPVMVGVVDALSCYTIAPTQLRVLSIGSGSRKPVLDTFTLRFGGLLGWLPNGALIESMMHYSSINADGQAGLLLGRERLMRVEPGAEAAGVHMTDYAAASRLLPPEAERVAAQRAAHFEEFLQDDRTAPRFFYGPRGS